MPRPIRARLTLWYVALLALFLVAFSAVLYGIVARTLYQQADDTLALSAEQFAGATNSENGALRFSSDTADAPDLGQFRASGYLVRLIDPTGQVVDTNSNYVAVPVSLASLASAQRGQTAFETVAVSNRSYRVYTTPIVQNGQFVGALQIAGSLEEVEAALHNLLLALAAIVPLTLVVATLGGIFFAQRALAPVDQITRAVQRINAEDLHQRLDINLPDDEVGRLARTFNQTLGRLDDSFRREREFTANASHELRTPLTVMRGEIEVALRRPREESEYQRVLRELGTDVERLTQLVEDLLTLARADAQRITIEGSELNAKQLLRAAADELSPLVVDKGIDLQIRAPDSLDFIGDEPKLLRVMLNLVGNAIKFSPRSGRVVLEAASNGQTLTLSVRDQGAGIPTDALPHIFDRFYRGAGVEANGVGLGLAIAKAFVAAHDGQIQVESTVGRGTQFKVILPLKTSAPNTASSPVHAA